MQTGHNARFSLQTGVADLLAAITPHVPFDGWSEAAFTAACADLGVEPAEARLIAPRGAVDLAVAYHRAGDAAMERAVAEADLAGLKFREKVAFAVRARLEAAEPELVARGSAVFALPQNAALGAELIWGTADKIWVALGDQSEDYNWYSKRATLSALYGAVVLYWMGDQSEGRVETWDFLARRIETVMGVEKVKGLILKLPGVESLLSGLRKPKEA